MTTLFKRLSEEKAQAYSEFNQLKTNFFEAKSIEFSGESKNLSSHQKTTPGFTTAFESKEDFYRQAQAPILMPLICLRESVKNLMHAVINFCNSVIHVLELNRSESVDAITQSFQNIAMSALFVGVALIDTFRQLSALFSRSGSTIVSSAYEGINHLMHKDEDRSEDDYESQDTSAQQAAMG